MAGPAPKALKTYFEILPFNSLMGVDVVESELDYCKVRLPFDKKLVRSYGVIHGGVVASLIDVAAGVAVMTAFPIENDRIIAKYPPATIEMKLNYLGPLKEEDAWAVANVIKRGRSIAVIDVEVTTDSGDLVAKGIVTYKIPSQNRG